MAAALGAAAAALVSVRGVEGGEDPPPPSASPPPPIPPPPPPSGATGAPLTTAAKPPQAVVVTVAPLARQHPPAAAENAPAGTASRRQLISHGRHAAAHPGTRTGATRCRPHSSAATTESRLAAAVGNNGGGGDPGRGGEADGRGSHPPVQLHPPAAATKVHAYATRRRRPVRRGRCTAGRHSHHTATARRRRHRRGATAGHPTHVVGRGGDKTGGGGGADGEGSHPPAQRLCPPSPSPPTTTQPAAAYPASVSHAPSAAAAVRPPPTVAAATDAAPPSAAQRQPWGVAKALRAIVVWPAGGDRPTPPRNTPPPAATIPRAATAATALPTAVGIPPPPPPRPAGDILSLSPQPPPPSPAAGGSVAGASTPGLPDPRCATEGAAIWSVGAAIPPKLHRVRLSAGIQNEKGGGRVVGENRQKKKKDPEVYEVNDSQSWRRLEQRGVLVGISNPAVAVLRPPPAASTAATTETATRAIGLTGTDKNHCGVSTPRGSAPPPAATVSATGVPLTHATILPWLMAAAPRQPAARQSPKPQEQRHGVGGEPPWTDRTVRAGGGGRRGPVKRRGRTPRSAEAAPPHPPHVLIVLYDVAVPVGHPRRGAAPRKRRRRGRPLPQQFRTPESGGCSGKGGGAAPGTPAATEGAAAAARLRPAHLHSRPWWRRGTRWRVSGTGGQSVARAWPTDSLPASWPPSAPPSATCAAPCK